MNTALGIWDYLILVVYLAGTMGLGLYVGRGIRTEKDYFLAGRRLPWWAIGMSLVATDIGGTDIIGVGGAAYAHGLAVANFEWIGCVPAMILAAFLFIPFFWRAGVYTIPEFMERRYSASVRTALALCWVVFMACNLGIMLLASAKMMSALFGWPQFACILVTALLVGIYTVAGGLAAVVYTDSIQCVVMIGGCLLVLVLGLIEVGGLDGLRQQLAALDAQHSELSRDAAANESAAGEETNRRTRLILPVDTESPFPWPGILFGLALVLSPAYWIGNQAIVQRSLGARSEFEARAAYVWGAVLKNVIPLVIAVPGLIAVVKFPELRDQDQAFPMLISHLLPIGLRGLFLAAFIAALMSSIDSYLNSASTLLTHDLYRRFVNRRASQSHLMWIGRCVTVALVCWAVAFAFYLTRRSEGIYTIFQTMMSFFQGPALAILLAGVLWRRATARGALVGFLGGVCCAIGLFALSQDAVRERLEIQPLFQVSEPFLYFSVWAFLTALGLHVLVSLGTRPDAPEKLAYVWGGSRALGSNEERGQSDPASAAE